MLADRSCAGNRSVLENAYFKQSRITSDAGRAAHVHARFLQQPRHPAEWPPGCSCARAAPPKPACLEGAAELLLGHLADVLVVVLLARLQRNSDGYGVCCRCDSYMYINHSVGDSLYRHLHRCPALLQVNADLLTLLTSTSSLPRSETTLSTAPLHTCGRARAAGAMRACMLHGRAPCADNFSCF